MTSPDDHVLTAELATLTSDAPDDLLDRIVARWVRVRGPIGDLYVASTDHGIAYVRTDEAVGEDQTAFAAAFRARFARPLLAAAGPPAGLLHALRSGRATGLRFDLRGLSEFDQAVLHATLRIPRGQLRPVGARKSVVGAELRVRQGGRRPQ